LFVAGACTAAAFAPARKIDRREDEIQRLLRDQGNGTSFCRLAKVNRRLDCVWWGLELERQLIAK